ncbi:MAG: hypothetical protein FWF15_08785 [Oscillospiraceae bacterium]|nr:hypothetical protein [Oscillospiraceae bacterium]
MKNFCLRYDEFKNEINDILSSVGGSSYADKRRVSNRIGDPTAEKTLRIENLSRKRELIEQTALEAGGEIYQPLLNNVTTGVTYEQMKARGIEILCGRRQFYEKRRNFFWLLNYKKG